MTNLLDLLVIGGGALYLTDKVKNNHDPEFKRLLLATAVGAGTYVLGPNLYGKVQNASAKSSINSNQMVSTVVGGFLGYYLSGKFDKKELPKE